MSGAKYLFSCAITTKKLNLDPGAWVKQLVETRELEWDTAGRLFYRALNPDKNKYADDFYRVLKRTQEWLETIDKSIEVSEKLVLMRSLP